MTEGEWGVFMASVLATFAGDHDAAREGALRHYFGAMPLDVAQRALDHLVAVGQTFVPVPGEMMRAVRFVTGGGFKMKVALSGLDEQTYLDRAYAAHRPAPQLPEGPQ